MMHAKLRENPLRTRDELARACRDLVDPLFAYLTPGKAQVDLRDTAAHYQDVCIGLEGFSRAMLGLVPFIAGGHDRDRTYGPTLLEGLTNGTNPQHPEFWGVPESCHQTFIEMGPFALALLMAPDTLYDPLDPKAKANLVIWLGAIHKMSRKPKNQIFFRILTNLSLHRVGSAKFNRRVMLDDLQIIDGMYLGDGWYNDGGAAKPHRSVDYYNPMAIHFYGLIYAKLARDMDPAGSDRLLERARRLAPQFTHWFNRDGVGIPFGRSLCYRTAQAAFWAGLAFADCEALPWGQIKGLLLRNLRDWFRRPIFNPDGVFSIGYGYPNLHVQEEYNSPTSPYLAMKPFLVLALPTDHPFWQADEEPLRKAKPIVVQPHGRHILVDSERSGHLWMLNGGGSRDYHLQHLEEKYQKFAYSTSFGFNVTSDTAGLPGLAADSNLLLAEGDLYYRGRGWTTDHVIGDRFLASRWKPWTDVEVTTWLAPLDDCWHVRIHHVHSGRALVSCEGGFALPRTDEHYRTLNGKKAEKRGLCVVFGSTGLSIVVDPTRQRKGSLVMAMPNTNVLHRQSLIPSLSGPIRIGDTWLLTLVAAHPDQRRGEVLRRAIPTLTDIRAALPAALLDVFASAAESRTYRRWLTKLGISRWSTERAGKASPLGIGLDPGPGVASPTRRFPPSQPGGDDRESTLLVTRDGRPP